MNHQERVIDFVNEAFVVKDHPFRYPTLATVSKNGPQQRTLVLRAFNPLNWTFTFYTDHRSNKVQELNEDNRAALHFYEPKQQLQMRWLGTVKIEHQNELSTSVLKDIPMDRRMDYESILAPGADYIENLEKSSAEDNFALLVFKAKSLDYLQLNAEDHLRYKADVKDSGSLNWRRVQP